MAFMTIIIAKRLSLDTTFFYAPDVNFHDRAMFRCRKKLRWPRLSGVNWRRHHKFRVARMPVTIINDRIGALGTEEMRSTL